MHSVLLEVLLLLADVAVGQGLSAHHQHALVSLGGGINDPCVVPLVFGGHPASNKGATLLPTCCEHQHVLRGWHATLVAVVAATSHLKLLHLR